MIIIGRSDRDYGPPPGYFGPGPGFHGDYPGPPPYRGGGRRNRDEGKTRVFIVLLLYIYIYILCVAGVKYPLCCYLAHDDYFVQIVIL